MPQNQRVLTSRQMAFYRFRRNPAALVGAVIVITVIIAAIFAPLLAPSPESAGSFVDFRNRHAAPSWDHWMGTDNVGCDVLSRVLYGYRVSLGLVVGVLGVAVPLIRAKRSVRSLVTVQLWRVLATSSDPLGKIPNQSKSTKS